MIIKNNITGKQYPIARADWEKMGKNKNLFTVLDEKDTPDSQPVTNIADKGQNLKSEPGKKQSVGNTNTSNNGSVKRPSSGDRK